ncbi:hypothetical protein IB223_04765 [Pseudoxanthomonas sp. PXM03]|uniref:hypothetical protein n=1 Tax=Pseudoxanthomonas sp. PXM03 TaxID=2769284 RepID=UPI00177F4548|nr:hypothetical protein [Pseudoxanthomonas sp. PXM03]MBD9435399.1 hypothetical protein [Pseudoxanthomonas sp. PXM03]
MSTLARLSIAAAVLLLFFLQPSATAVAQSTIVIACEQGDVNSWKICEVRPDTFARYVWSTTGVANLDPFVCTENSSVCTAWCEHTNSSGQIHVTVYNAAGQPVASRSRSLGCGAG